MANSPQEVEALFSSAALNYDQGAAENKYIGPEWLREQLLKLPSQKFGKVLDLACANGTTAAVFRKLDSTCEITGVDISAAMIAEAKKREVCNHLQVHDLNEAIQFVTSQSQDILVCLGAIEFLNDAATFLNRSAKFLKSGGKAFFTFQEHEVGNKNAPRNTRSLTVTHTAYTMEEIQIMLTEAGFKDIQLKKNVGYISGSGYHCPYVFVSTRRN